MAFAHATVIDKAFDTFGHNSQKSTILPSILFPTRERLPACVQTRLDEFMAGPGKRPGVKVSYLKPLCVEVEDQLHFTSRDDIQSAIAKVQAEVFAEYRRMYLPRRGSEVSRQCLNRALAIPRSIIKSVVQRRQKAIDAYHAKMEYKRRCIALRAARAHGQLHVFGSSFDEMLELTNPINRLAVIEQYSIDQELSRAKRDQLLRMAAGQIPWFMVFSAGLSMGLSYLSALSTLTITFAPPLMVCDPAFVAEMPGSGGVLLNIGHFDDIAGVRHIEL